MNGVIGFQNLEIVCTIGVLPTEKLVEQSIFVDLKIESDISKCVVSDAVADTVDYTKLEMLCRQIATSKHYNLIETLASDIIEHVSSGFSANFVYVKIKKPNAIKEADFTYVEMEKRL